MKYTPTVKRWRWKSSTNALKDEPNVPELNFTISFFATCWGSVVTTVTDIFNGFPSLCRSDGVMRTMNTEKLLKTVPIIQNQMDVLLDFNVSFLCLHSAACYLLSFGVTTTFYLF